MIPRIIIAMLLAACLPAGEAALAPSASAPAPAGYRLYPGDLVVIKVFDHEDLAISVRVPSAGGGMTFPLIGEVQGLAGRSAEELGAEITTRLADGYIRSPRVTVSVGEFGSRSFSVVGSVVKPGEIPLDPLAPVTALQAIGKAGGFLDVANRRTAVVLREDPARPGMRSPIPVPMLGDAAQRVADVRLVAGDVVMVPALERAFVIGMVQHPGPVIIPATEPLTVSKAISLTGGFEKFARQSEVQLIREGQKVETVDVRAVLTGGEGARDPRLLPGDTVFVPESRL